MLVAQMVQKPSATTNRSEEMKYNILKCLRCNHEWPSKQSHPTICPKCKSPYWDKEKKNG